MALPIAARQALAKLKQGPVQVMVDPGGADEAELFVRDGVDLTFLQSYEAAEVDVVGTYDLYSSEDSAEFEVRCPETSQEVLNVIFQGHTEGGTYGGYTYHGFGRTAGQSQRDNAKKFRFRPWQTRDSNQNQVDLWLCAPSGNATASQKKAEPHTWVQPFRAFPDLTKSDGCLIGRIFADTRA